MDRRKSGISEEELGAAVSHIEAALQLAFSGEPGARRIALEALARSEPQPVGNGEAVRAHLGHLSAAIAELDRLRIRAERSGVPMGEWLEAVAEDIKAAAPALDLVALESVISLARRMADDPRRTLGAQAHFAGGAVRTLTG
jgi:hypothetical protein